MGSTPNVAPVGVDERLPHFARRSSSAFREICGRETQDFIRPPQLGVLALELLERVRSSVVRPGRRPPAPLGLPHPVRERLGRAPILSAIDVIAAPSRGGPGAVLERQPDSTLPTSGENRLGLANGSHPRKKWSLGKPGTIQHLRLPSGPLVPIWRADSTQG
jgi:hypothetical protein